MAKYIWWYERDNLIAEIAYEGEWPSVRLISYKTFSSDKLDWPMLGETNLSLKQLFEERQAPKKNFGETAKQHFGFEHYHAENMCRMTHGAMPHDTFWMKFENDPDTLLWRDVAVDEAWRTGQEGTVDG